MDAEKTPKAASPPVETQSPAAQARALVIKWAGEQPLWKQDALRRVLVDVHTSTDVDEVAKAVIAAVNPKDVPSAKPLAAEDFGTSVDGHAGFHVLELRDVAHVNRLAPNQVLKFGKAGLTAVYGDNGSGKSGYARIFKSACGARDKETVLANVFEAPPATPGRATFVAGGLNPDPLTVEWKNEGLDAQHPLNSIPIFDSRAAPFYVEKSAVLSFVPYGLGCFERLASLLDDVVAKINQRISAIDAASGKPLVEGALQEWADKEFVALVGLDAKKLEERLTWTTDLEAAFDAASDTVANPGARVTALGVSAAELAKFADSLREAQGATSDENVDLARRTFSDYSTAKAAAELSASEAFAGQPLPGVGTDPWRLLFDAAREFAAHHAYVGREGLPHQEGDRCVLCLQELTDEARARLDSFESFIAGEASKKADEAKKTLDQRRESYSKARASFSELALDSAVMSAAASEAAELETARATVAKRFNAITDILDGQPAPDIAPQAVLEWAKYAEKAAQLKSAAEALQKRIDQGDTTKLAEELAVLQVKRAFCNAPAVIKERLGLLSERADLLAATTSCGTSNVTKRGGELIRQFVTDELTTRFAKERAALHVTNVEVQLNASAKKGSVERSLGLGKQLIKATPPQILSEGEYRAVALAAFFAEQSMHSRLTPMVIDDPVSSLDHTRREQVANRIATEAKQRQVIVFTHDLPFFLMLEAACSAVPADWTRVYLERAKGGYGAVSEQPAPWDAQKFKERKDNLSKRLAALKAHHKDVGEDEAYRDMLTAFYDRLRKTWERGLEELLFAGTVVRFRPSLQTLRLRDVPIDNDLYKSFTDGMTNASKITGHDQTSELGGSWPTPDKAEELLKELQDFEKLAKLKSQEFSKGR